MYTFKICIELSIHSYLICYDNNFKKKLDMYNGFWEIDCPTQINMQKTPVYCMTFLDFSARRIKGKLVF